MAIRNIVLEGDPMLRKKSKPVREVNDHIREIMGDMLDTMHEHLGVGLAAPQVGVMRRMFVAEPEPDDVYYMINPEIIESDGSQEGPEGCLSVPDLEGIVDRPMHIKIKAQDLDGNEQEYDFEDFHARVMCHEYDHLDGVLYIDKAVETYDPEEKYKEMAEEIAAKNAELKEQGEDAAENDDAADDAALDAGEPDAAAQDNTATGAAEQDAAAQDNAAADDEDK